MKVMGILLVLLMQVVFGCGSASAQAPPPPTFPCQGEKESAQFDFWVGEWDVYTQGQLTGKSRIEALPGGCLLTENYESLPAGYAGKSLNFYDPEAKAWKQVWVDNGGNIARFEGQLKDGSMVLSGQRISRGRPGNLSRMTFTPNPDGTVRQWIEVSRDGGKTWQPGFDGRYVRRKAGG